MFNESQMSNGISNPDFTRSINQSDALQQKGKSPRGTTKLSPVSYPQNPLRLEEPSVRGTEQTQILKQIFKNNPTTQRANGNSVAQSINFKKTNFQNAYPETSKAVANHARNRY